MIFFLRENAIAKKTRQTSEQCNHHEKKHDHLKLPKIRTSTEHYYLTEPLLPRLKKKIGEYDIDMPFIMKYWPFYIFYPQQCIRKKENNRKLSLQLIFLHYHFGVLSYTRKRPIYHDPYNIIIMDHTERRLDNHICKWETMEKRKENCLKEYNLPTSFFLSFW